MSEQLTPEWHDLDKYPAPEWARCRAQDKDGKVYDYDKLPCLIEYGFEYADVKLVGRFEVIGNWQYSLVTIDWLRAKQKLKQDQSTDANLSQGNNAIENNALSNVDDTNVADSQVIPEGFTPWDGSECPVPLGTMVDVILQTGDVVLGNAANDTKELFLSDQRVNKNGWWNRTDYPFDIIAYRLSEPATDNVYQAENSDQLDEKLDIPPPAYNPPYEMIGSALIDDVVANNVEAFNRLDDVKAIERKPTFGDWIDGYPQHPFSTEWCIVKFNTKIGVAVVRALSDENSYDFETADATYFKKELIKCWMPMPDSGFIHPFDDAKDKYKAIQLLDQAQIAVNQPLDKRVQYLIESREEDQNFIQSLVAQRETPPPQYDPKDVAPQPKHAHYFKQWGGELIDIYAVLDMFDVKDQAIGHAIKKLLMGGNRGYKDTLKDWNEAIDSINRAIQIKKFKEGTGSGK